MLYDKAEYGPAIKLYNEAIKHYSSSAKLYSNRAAAYMKRDWSVLLYNQAQAATA